MKMQLTVAVAAAALAVPGVTAGAAHADGSRTTFVARAVEKAGNLVTLPVHQGTSQGRQVWYVVLDASTSEAAATYGVNRSNKLRNARGTSAVQKVIVRNGVIDFPASVDFSPVRVPARGGRPRRGRRDRLLPTRPAAGRQHPQRLAGREPERAGRQGRRPRHGRAHGHPARDRRLLPQRPRQVPVHRRLGPGSGSARGRDVRTCPERRTLRRR